MDVLDIAFHCLCVDRYERIICIWGETIVEFFRFAADLLPHYLKTHTGTCVCLSIGWHADLHVRVYTLNHRLKRLADFLLETFVLLRIAEIVGHQ